MSLTLGNLARQCLDASLTLGNLADQRLDALPALDGHIPERLDLDCQLLHVRLAVREHTLQMADAVARLSQLRLHLSQI